MGFAGVGAGAAGRRGERRCRPRCRFWRAWPPTSARRTRPGRSRRRRRRRHAGAAAGAPREVLPASLAVASKRAAFRTRALLSAQRRGHGGERERVCQRGWEVVRVRTPKGACLWFAMRKRESARHRVFWGARSLSPPRPPPPLPLPPLQGGRDLSHTTSPPKKRISSPPRPLPRPLRTARALRFLRNTAKRARAKKKKNSSPSPSSVNRTRPPRDPPRPQQTHPAPRSRHPDQPQPTAASVRAFSGRLPGRSARRRRSRRFCRRGAGAAVVVGSRVVAAGSPTPPRPCDDWRPSTAPRASPASAAGEAVGAAAATMTAMATTAAMAAETTTTAEEGAAALATATATTAPTAPASRAPSALYTP